MYLKSLVLKGFKSFADRSALSMEPGITAIVGPNGSGKSNISDAVLWVLGERNAKHLRGQAMEDVIFAGSSARKPTSLAEVTLVLDNSDGTLPVDYDEVAIGRRMYRSGESEYLINGTVARRMDVLDILHDSGLGTGTHSIISQGSLDSILQSKPEDRRALIEEAAGTLKHKQRKAKSERKLAAMDAHLARVRDVAQEVHRQLGPLERKAKRARKHAELSEQLSGLTLAIAVDDLRTLRESWDKACAAESAAQKGLEGRKAQVDAAEKRVEEIEARIRREQADAGVIAKRQSRVQSAVERFDGAVLLLHEKRRAAQGYVADLELGLESNKAKRAEAASERDHAQSQLAEVRASRAKADADVERLTAEQRENAAARRDGEREMEQLERSRRSDEREQDRARRDLAKTQEALASGLAHVRLVEGRGKELELELERAEQEAAEKAKASEAAAAELASLIEAETSARKKVAAALSARDEARRARDKARDAVAVVKAEIKGFEERERASSAAGPARAWLLDRAEAAGEPLGLVSHAVHAPEGREALVEHLLGADVAALLAADSETAMHWADDLAASGQKGAVSLVACTPEEGVPARVPARMAAAGGAGTALIDELSYPADQARAVEALLGDVVVCASLEAAFAAHRAHPDLHARFVTEAGDVVWPNGKLTVGFVPDSGEAGALARARRLEAARSRAAEEQRSEDEAQAAEKAAEESLRAAQAEGLDLSQRLAQQRGTAQSAKNDAARAAEKLSGVRRESEEVARQRSQAESSVAQARPAAEALEKRLAELASSIDAAAARLEELQDEVVPLRKKAAQLRDALNEAKLSAAKLAERENYASRIVVARERDLASIDEGDARSRAQLAVKRVALARIEPLLAVLEELTDSVRSRQRGLADAAADAQGVSDELHNEANEARARSRAARDAHDEANAALSAARVEKGRLEVQVDAAVNGIVRDLGTPLETALSLPELTDRGAAENEALGLRRRIQNLGTVNPDAAAEYEALKGRYDYLASQLADLDGARRSLTRIVHVIDARMKDDFSRTFQQVDENFRAIFAQLFPGGSAELSLVDPEDVENTGVEVSAQPRGKRIAKMTLMSGGEKSLTAIALLFAVYRIRHAPFYILDEVEAALDDTNLRRLVAYLNGLRDETQLIMITHQRRTMEMSDVLFGVSMQADGVTKVISQKLDRALRYAE